MKSLVLMLFSLSIFTLQFNTSYSQSKRSEPVKIYFDGEVYSSHYNPGNIKNATIEKIDNVKVYNSISFINLAVLRNYYDTQSNGTPVQIWQDPANPNNIHAVYTYSSQPTGWSDRTIQYFFSSDKGTTWSFIGNVPTTGRAGFPTITGLSNGIPIIGCHTNTGASTLVRTQFFVDAFPGLGSFTNLNPGASEDSKYIWPRVIATQNTSLANKFIFISSTSNTTFDSCFWNSGTSVTSSIFTGYKKLNTASAAESYAIGCGVDGRIGIAYIASGLNNLADVGDVYYMESTNSGTSFGTPLRIFNSDFISDSLCALRGISMVFKDNSPCVVFETVVREPTSNGYYPQYPSKIRFWCPAINSGISLVIADKNNVPFAPAYGTTDTEAPICRPSIGISGDGTMLFCSMIVQSLTTGGNDSTSYTDIYLSRSSNGGNSWVTPERITPISPRNDWSYGSISPINDYDANNLYVNLIMQKDTIPGNNVTTNDSRTFAKPYYVRVGYQRTLFPPAVPTLLSPGNGTSSISIVPTLSWSSTGLDYRLQISTNVGFTGVIYDQSAIAQPQIQIPQPTLSNSTTYYWRVSARNDNGSSAFSSPFSFTTTATPMPSIPTLITPANGSINTPLLPAFDWSDISGGTSYNIQIASSPTFTSPVFDTTVASSSLTMVSNILSGSTTYYWRVRGTNINGTSLFSGNYSFTTAQVLSAPTLISPANGAIGISLTPNMSWQTVSGATSYNIQIATDLAFNNIIYNVNPSISSQSVPSGTLALNTLYFWRVRSSNAGGSGPFSATWNFRSTVVGLNNITVVIPTEFKLYNNYPNPFNPNTKIKFDLPRDSDVKITIFDISGKMVQELLSMALPAGTYEKSFNATALSSGIYYYKIETGSFIDTKKMILVK